MLMKTILISIALLTVVSCKKEAETTACQCYEKHETLIFTYPNIFTWEEDYSTDVSTDFCVNDTGVWEYNDNSTKRHRTICQ